MREPPTVVLRWGSDLFILGADGVLETHASPAAPGALAAVLGPRLRAGARVRLIHHPDPVVVRAASGGEAGTRLQRILRRLRGAEGKAAALALGFSIEDPAGFPADPAAALRLEGAWALPALIEAALGDAPRTDGYLAVVAIGGRIALCSSTPGGVPWLREFSGEDGAFSALAALRSFAARFEENRPPRILCVRDSPQEHGPLLGALPGAPEPALSTADFLALARGLRPGDASDFLRERGRGRLRLRPRTALAAVAALGALVVAWRFHEARADALRRDAWRSDQVRLEAWTRERERDRDQIAALDGQRALASVRPPPLGDFLVRLARAATPGITLRSLVIQDGVFRATGVAATPGALARLRQALASPAPAGVNPSTDPGGNEFEVDGGLAGGEAEAPSLPGDLAACTPAEVNRARARRDAALASLASVDEFEGWVADLAGDWVILSRSSAAGSPMEVRRCGLARRESCLGDWPAIVETVRRLCEHPGLRVDRLVLAAAPGGADRFERVELSLEALLRPSPSGGGASSPGRPRRRRTSRAWR